VILYVTPNRRFAVRYITHNGTYDVVRIETRTAEFAWPVLGNRDYKHDAIGLAERLDQQEEADQR
jgi:hypothetical protein